MRSHSRFSPLAALALAGGACNAIFGIEPGLTGGAGGASSAAHGSSSAGGAAGSSTTTTTTTSTASTSSTSSGGPCLPADSATCDGDKLVVCDSVGHTPGPVTCDAIAACDAAAGTCNDGSFFGRLGVGHARACAIEDDRSVKCWGDNENGSLVPADMHDMVPAPEHVDGISNARQISVGSSHQCVLQDDGTLTCWGANDSGQLGAMPGAPQPPMPVPGLTGVVEVRAGDQCTCARLVGGAVDCFGVQDYGCLGTGAQVMGPQPSPTPIGVTGAVQIRLGGEEVPSCALLASGQVTCWNDSIPVTEVPGVSDATDVSVGFGLVFIRDKTGVLWSAPKQDHSGWTTVAPYPITPGITAMASGDSFCGLRIDGIVTCALLGGGSPPPPPSPVLMQPMGPVVEIAAGSSAGYDLGLQCLRVSGAIASSVSCWGDDGEGALGIGAPEDILTPAGVVIPGSTVAFLSTAESSTFAVLADGSVMAWGTAYAVTDPATAVPTALPFLDTGNVSIQNNDPERRVYVLEKAAAPMLIESEMPMFNARLLSTGFTDFVDTRPWFHWDIGLRAGGAVVIYAETTDANAAGVFGDGTTAATADTVVTVQGITAKAVASYGTEYNSSDAHVCVILDPAGSVECWGWNGSGEVGSGAPGAAVLSPAAVAIPGNEAVVSLAAGASFTCAVTASGKVYCWGDNQLGQLGHTTGGMSATPLQVAGIANAVGVTAREAHACAWLSDQTVKCWGQNHFGQLGDGTLDIPAQPVVVTGLHSVVQVSAGTDHTCARRMDGSVACWGSSYGGQIGTGKMGVYASPMAVGL